MVEAIFSITDHIPAAKQEGLEHFCEFIEDCEFPDLAARILHHLAQEGPKFALFLPLSLLPCGLDV